MWLSAWPILTNFDKIEVQNVDLSLPCRIFESRQFADKFDDE